MKKLMQFGVVAALIVGLASACNAPVSSGNQNSSSTSNEVELPDFPATPDDGKPSWEHDNESFDMTWYVNTSWFTWTSNGTDTVSRILKEKTGVSIRIITPVTDSGELLTTMIASDNLPDVISLQAWYPQVTQLASQGYVYPLNDLMDKWAPSFKERLQDDVWNWFKHADGKTYGLPNYAYSNEYLEEGEKLEPNGAILVREDWYYEVEQQGIDMTTPSGFIAGAKYIKEKYDTAIPVQLDNFDLEGNPSLNWLAQFFAVPFETIDGKYQYPITHPRYLEMMEFVNELYRQGLISDANFSANTDQVKRSLAGGNVFVSMVTPQDYSQAFYSTFNKGIKYIPLVLRNKDKEAPILQDIRGMGFLFSMITKNAARPDKIIKVFEYLYSEEGQRLIAFGEEGVTWNWEDETQTKVAWTEKYLTDLANEDTGKYGLYQMNLLLNLVYINKIKPDTGKTASDIYLQNMKEPLSPYSYDYTANFLKPLKADTSNPNYFQDYFQISTKENQITTAWASWIPKIIRSTTKEKAVETYNSAINDLKRRGLDEVTTFYNESFQIIKGILNVEHGWPGYKEGYVEPTTGPNGDFSYWEGDTYVKPTN